MRDRSVFKDYREDTDPYLKKCFKQDMEYAKIFKLFKDPDVYDRVLETLFSHYM